MKIANRPSITEKINTRLTEHTSLLSLEEIENPFLVIHDLMDSSELSEIRDTWWNILYYAFSSAEADGLRASTRAEYLFIHKAILKLAEAASIIAPWNLQDKMDRIKTLCL